jgi:hypothetical protein
MKLTTSLNEKQNAYFKEYYQKKKDGDPEWYKKRKEKNKGWNKTDAGKEYKRKYMQEWYKKKKKLDI